RHTSFSRDWSSDVCSSDLSVAHRQAGLEWRRRLAGGNELRLRAWGGERRMRQYLAFVGAGPTSAGGVVDLDRGFGGVGAQWTRRPEERRVGKGGGERTRPG